MPETASAQVVDTSRLLIDTHQHLVPDFYLEWLSGHGQRSIGDRPQPDWSVDLATTFMNSFGISTAVLSLATPNVYVGPQPERAHMARRVNEYLAELKRRYPGRFGFFANLPLPDIEASVEVAQHSLDELSADGVVCLSHVDGAYISDPRFRPVLEVLNDRSSVLFVHPHIPPFDPAPGINPGAADFLLETVRAAIGFSIEEVHERFGNLKIILSHAGGFLPFAAARFAAVCGSGDLDLGLSRLRRFYFDTALSTSPQALDCLLQFADPQRILFGSDWPWAAEPRVRYFTELFRSFPFTEAQSASIRWENAAQLLPALGL